MILDTIILIAGLIIYLVLSWKPKAKDYQNIKGSNLIVKAKATGIVIHIGQCFDVTNDTVWGVKADGLYFHASRAKLFWSEAENAFVERV